jgi:hypothetical protein
MNISEIRILRVTMPFVIPSYLILSQGGMHVILLGELSLYKYSISESITTTGKNTCFFTFALPASY